ncbi:ATP-binding protein [Streptomyces sp. B93]|uniref:ATP-binding protein n=1 Tax=Streptomyces sp. B93 TaxID=2824875 RepID=UPI001B376E1F|nr:ATP-binding protein [Streptomyces sp. B93]MBQ1093611.1 ATP-binding protein [Streptomyces sp. B93]
MRFTVTPPGQRTADGQQPNATTAPRRRASWSPDAGGGRAADARRAVRTFLAEAVTAHGAAVSALAEIDAQVVADELLANAFRHAPGDCGMDLELSPDGTELTIGVWDTSPQPPRVQPPGPTRVGGHGLRLVEACSREVTVVPTGRGKRVVARLGLS